MTRLPVAPRRRPALVLGAGLLVVAGLTGGVLLAIGQGHARTPAVVAQQDAQPVDRFHALTAAQVSALPEARYDAVIPGLQPYRSSSVPAVADRVYTVRQAIAVYDAVDGRPVARIPVVDFLRQPTVVVPVAFDGAWALVLTPSRQALPSSDAGDAPAQTAGWVRRDALRSSGALREHIEIDVATGHLEIRDARGSVRSSFEIGVGAHGTPTPTGVLGYLQARYLDPLQGQATYPITLTSLHATTRDEPYEGHDGGLIGMHYHWVTRGAVSHGCLRLPAAALKAVDALPLGTPVLLRS